MGTNLGPRYILDVAECKVLSGLPGFWAYSPLQVDRTWCMRGSYYNIPKAILNLLKGDYNRFRFRRCGC